MALPPRVLGRRAHRDVVPLQALEPRASRRDLRARLRVRQGFADARPARRRANARPAKRAFEGDSISIDLKLVSSRGTRGPARMTGSVGGVELATAAGLVTKKGWTERKLIKHVRRGPVISTGWALDTGDLLGFFKERGTRTQGNTELALLLPRLTSLGARPRVRELEASAASSRAGTGTELFGVREYRPGDPLRRIHWRSS